MPPCGEKCGEKNAENFRDLECQVGTSAYKGHELWCGRTKSAHKINSVAQIITTTTRNLLGKPISPHLFRTCAASTAYRYVGKNPRLASALLGHRAPEVTEQHYNRAQSINFSKRYSALIETQIRNVSNNKHQL
jgi:integrase